MRRALVKDVYEGKATDTSASMGTPYDTDPQLHLYATAYGWGGLAIVHAGYVPIIRNQTKIEDGKTLPSSLTFTPPEIDEGRGGFWSVITYDAEGWIARDKASISNSEVAPNVDGSYTIHFNSPGKANNLDTPRPRVPTHLPYLNGTSNRSMPCGRNTKRSSRNLRSIPPTGRGRAARSTSKPVTWRRQAPGALHHQPLWQAYSWPQGRSLHVSEPNLERRSSGRHHRSRPRRKQFPQVDGEVMATGVEDEKKALTYVDDWNIRTMSEFLGQAGPKPKIRKFVPPAGNSWLKRVNFVLADGTMTTADAHWLGGDEQIQAGKFPVPVVQRVGK